MTTLSINKNLNSQEHNHAKKKTEDEKQNIID